MISNRIDPILGLIGESDTWLVRTDSRGRELWNYRFNDPGLDYPLSVLPIQQDGFFVVGNSSLGWLNDSGIRLPDQLLINPQVQLFQLARHTSDGGLVLGGIYNHPYVITNGVFVDGHWDIWLGQFNADGTEQRQKTYGGARTETVTDVVETQDGGFLVVGDSNSPPDENKTSPLFDGPNPDPFGIFSGDVWVFRTDAEGRKLWDRSFGTEQADWPGIVEPTSDGGALLLWWSLTPDFTDTYLHLTRIDAGGNELWGKTLESGSGFQKVIEMSDGGFLLGGYAPTGTNELKRDPGYGMNDGWLLRLDAMGNRLWDLALGGSGDDGLQTLERTTDGGFILDLLSASGMDGNKTAPNFGDYDFWAVKLGPERSLDSDGDGVPDDHDQCPNTPPHAIVNAEGCSVEQLVPCDAPWRNHGQYVRAVVKVTRQFREAGLISHKQRLGIFLRAVRSECGKKLSEKSSKSAEGNE